MWLLKTFNTLDDKMRNVTPASGMGSGFPFNERGEGVIGSNLLIICKVVGLPFEMPFHGTDPLAFTRYLDLCNTALILRITGRDGPKEFEELASLA